MDDVDGGGVDTGAGGGTDVGALRDVPKIYPNASPNGSASRFESNMGICGTEDLSLPDWDWPTSSRGDCPACGESDGVEDSEAGLSVSGRPSVPVW